MLRQALIDLDKTSPAHIAKLRARIEEPGISVELRSKRRGRWGEASDIRHELLAWLESPDFDTVVGWSGFEKAGVRKAFDTALAEQGQSVEQTNKRKGKKNAQ